MSTIVAITGFAEKAVATEQSIEQTFQCAMKLVRLSKEELGDLGDLTRELNGSTQADIARHLNNLHMQLANCDERLGNLTDSLLDGFIPKDAFEERRLALLGKRQALLNQLADPRLKQPPAQIVLNYLELPFIKQIGSNSAFSCEVRQIVESVCWNFVVDGKRPAIALKSPYREILEWRLSTKGGPNRYTFGTRVRELLDILIEVAKREVIAPEAWGGAAAIYFPATDQPALAA